MKSNGSYSPKIKKKKCRIDNNIKYIMTSEDCHQYIRCFVGDSCSNYAIFHFIFGELAIVSANAAPLQCVMFDKEEMVFNKQTPRT